MAAGRAGFGGNISRQNVIAHAAGPKPLIRHIRCIPNRAYRLVAKVVAGMYRQGLQCFAVAFALLAACVAADAAPAALTQLPARFEGKNVFLQVSLNGGTPVWMKFEAGTSESSVSADYLKKIAPGANNSPVLNVKIGPVALNGVQFALDRPTPAAGPGGSVLAGRLGEDSLGDRVLMIRYAKRQVFLSPPIDTAGAIAAAQDSSHRTVAVAYTTPAP
jgi:hypothetical protein